MNKLKVFLYSLFILLFITSCSSPQKGYAPKVEVSKNRFISLPKPSSFDKDLSLAQLITIRLNDKSEQVLPIQLEINQSAVNVAGFSTWGTPVFTLIYDGAKINSNIIPNIVEDGIDPKDILFYLMVSIWPLEPLNQSLDKIDWKIKETNLHRQLINDKNDVIVDVFYEKIPFYEGSIHFTHNQLHFSLTINTSRSK